MKIEYNKDITSLTTFGVPAKAAIYAEYESEQEFLRLSRTPEFTENERLCIGGGSNLLFLNKFKGMLLHSKIKGIRMYKKNEETLYVIAGAGEKWTDLVDWCLDRNLAGLENMAGIPGDVGASAVQNVGAYGAEAKDFIHSVLCFDVQTRQKVTLYNKECEFAYRNSIFKHKAKGRYIVLSVSFRLRQDTIARNLNYKSLRTFADGLNHQPTIKEVAAEVIRQRDSKLPNPSEVGSAGSFFKNPILHKYFLEQEISTRGVEIPTFEVEGSEDHLKVPAAWLIDNAGLKGYRIGGAEVWPAQPLVIDNAEDATAEDVAKLASHVQRTVKQKFGIRLEPEVNFIDSSIKVTILGSGTSKGIPEIGCTCRTCRSFDPKDKRQRASVLVETLGLRILIDASPDLRQQALHNGIDSIDAVLLTHQHYDHVGGIDDLRPLCAGKDMLIYANEQTFSDLHNRIDYCFRQHPYPGVPRLDLRSIPPQPFYVDGLKIEPVEVMHGKLPIYGYRINNFAYITDCKTLPESEKDKLKGLDVLILNCLRLEKEHFAHIILPEALALVDELKPKRCYFTHMCHMIGRHEEVAEILPRGVELAYDNEVIYIP